MMMPNLAAPTPRSSLLGGDWRPAIDNSWYEIVNPANFHQVVGLVPDMGERDVELALDAAADSQSAWSHHSLLDRGLILSRAADELSANAADIAKTVTLEMGKTIKESRAEVFKAADFLTYYAGIARAAIGTVLPDGRTHTTVSVVREPIGRVAIIAPWNDPVITPIRKMAPALICGNSVILKAAPESPLSALLIAKALDDAGLPRGVLSVITGANDDVGRALIAHNTEYDALSFTGSTIVGKTIAAQLGGSNIRFEAEMGGKNCAVVTRHADLHLAIEAVLSGAYVQAGQRCTATSRLLVESTVYSQFMERLSDAVAHLAVGPGMDEATEMGPLVSQERRDTVLSAVTASGDSGATILAGGRAPNAPSLTNGAYLEPTLLSDVDVHTEAWTNELFAPVLATREVTDVDEAISEVNNGDYGLSAAIFTDSLSEAASFAEEVDAGCIAINAPTAGWDAHIPFGGFKESGTGEKEQGLLGLEFYSRWKSVAVRTR